MKFFLIILVLFISCSDSSTDEERFSPVVKTLFTGVSAGSLTIDDDGNLYLSDVMGPEPSDWNKPTGKRIIKFSNEGILTEFAGGLTNPVGKAFDSKANLFVNNYYGNKVTKHYPDGKSEDFATSVPFPSGMVIGKNDTLYIVEMFSRRISKIAPDGTKSVFAASPELNWVNGIILDDRGDIYGANWSNGKILKITKNGIVSVFAQLPVAGPSGFQGSGFVAYGNNRFYATSLGTNKVYEISRAGEVTVLAGSGYPGHKDGSLKTAMFEQPNGIILSNDGKKIYVSETLKRRIRIIELKK